MLPKPGTQQTQLCGALCWDALISKCCAKAEPAKLVNSFWTHLWHCACLLPIWPAAGVSAACLPAPTEVARSRHSESLSPANQQRSSPRSDETVACQGLRYECQQRLVGVVHSLHLTLPAKGQSFAGYIFLKLQGGTA